jgi:hypothetical protein
MTRKDAKKLEDSDTNKFLINFYLFADAVEKIDDVLFYLKKKLPIDKRRKITKSVFYEIGLRIVAEEFNKRGEESPKSDVH